ncbi:olfactory receptor 2AT4-like isoform X2 [Pelodiscus sinensis]|nr:olfactory receptor 2AT4-like [Pelodiscus sinensis]|eukprot:XP_006127599.2 olfactory receptor 2AT4-like [Pelodiscus sinensis]
MSRIALIQLKEQKYLHINLDIGPQKRASYINNNIEAAIVGQSKVPSSPLYCQKMSMPDVSEGMNKTDIFNHQTMNNCNSNTSAKDFYLTGFPALQDFQIPLFLVFLLCYLIILIGNTIIIAVVVIDQTLHKPMYFFITNLSVLDILLTTTTIPKMLAMFLVNAKTISFHVCFLQMYGFHGLAVTESLLLVVMSYDRYEAICNPLHYPVKMTKKVNLLLAACAWVTGLLIPIPVIFQTTLLTFGEKNTVYNCFCDHLAVVQAACSDVSVAFQTFLGFSIAMTVSFLPLVLVTLSYVHIIISILKINSNVGRSKAFSTCTSHLIVVCTYYSSIALAYISYRTDLPIDVHIMSNVVFAILTPLLNPLIYTLRNKEVKCAVNKFLFLKLFPPFIKP